MNQKKNTKVNNLAVKNSKLAIDWHPTKNRDLTPYDVTPNSHRKVWWKCSKGHEWISTVNNRNKGRGCPYCAGKKVGKDNNLAVKNFELAKEWHPTKNGNLTPYDISPGSGKKAWWQCRKCPEAWQASIDNRNKGHGCPYCSGQKVGKDNNLAVKNPDLAKEWHPTKNGKLTSWHVRVYSNKKIWWQCRKNKDHEWQAIIASRNKGLGCPYCSGKKVSKENNLAVKNPDLAKEWHPTKNDSLMPYDVTSGSNKKIWWVCDKGHEWNTQISNRTRGTACPYCSREKRRKKD